MVCLIIAFPQLVTAGLDQTRKVDIDSVQIEIPSAYEYDPTVPADIAPAEPSGPAQ